MPTDNPFDAVADTDLMLRVQWGSEPAFAELYRRYYRKLLDFFYGMSGNVQRAEDLCHETFLRIWLLRVRYTVTGPFAAYLFAVARHIWLEGQREARKTWRLGLVRFLDREEADQAVSRDPAPDELAHRLEIDAQVLSALGTLPEEQRMAFVLRTIEGLSLEDIAAIMRCPINTVRSRRLLAIHRLREALRGLLVL